MFIVMGGTGHVGSAVASHLLDEHKAVTVVVHRESERSNALKSRGATIAIADVHDSDTLRKVFETGSRLFMLNPPAPPSTDIEVKERATIAAMLDALRGSSIEAIVAQSTYGARDEDRTGDLGTLFRMEEGLRSQDIPFVICRAAYYMTNWDEPIKIAKQTGKLTSMFPIDLALPMVAPRDAGWIAAHFLLNFENPGSIHYVEGPARYTLRDVAAALTAACPRLEFEPESIPPSKWKQSLTKMGFSQKAAESFERMFQLTVKHNSENVKITSPLRGTTSLQTYISSLNASL